MAWQFWIDRGGTFTDVLAKGPDGAIQCAKMLSDCPDLYRDAAVAGIRQILGLNSGAPIPRELVDQIKMGTTVATNALLERKGARTLLLTDAGFSDLLLIGNQTRPHLFELDIRRPDPLFEAVEEIGGRVDAHGVIVSEFDESEVRAMLSRHRDAGLEACAIALIHAWRFPAAEQRLAELARECGFRQVSVSSEVSPLVGLVPRMATTVVDAYLTPVLRRYVGQLTEELPAIPIYFMQSSGGMIDAGRFVGKDAVLSGPAGGVVGSARTALAAGFERVIGFDMGGTSTDVTLYDGAFERVFDTEIAGVPMRVPMMDVRTIAAGGGSILRFDGARFRVGPESAGANPGPACYRRGGPLTITDANVLLGKVQPAYFPALFGPEGNLPLDRDCVMEQFAVMAKEVHAATGRRQDPRDIAEGFIKVAVASMAAMIKSTALEKGKDVREFVLQSFGGAAGQHACLVAEELGLDTVLIHPFAGVLSAYGMGLADQSAIRQQAVERDLDAAGVAHAAGLEETLKSRAAEAISGPDSLDGVAFETWLEVRYEGSDTALRVPFVNLAEVESAFDDAHVARFGFATPSRPRLIQSVIVEATRAGDTAGPPEIRTRIGGSLAPVGEVEIWSGGQSHRAAVFDRQDLVAGDQITAPAMIKDQITTIVIEPGWVVTLGRCGELVCRHEGAGARRPASVEADADPVLLELFGCMFSGVAEQMGAVLRATSASVNIKERLDFSCAVFDAEGRLVANAPHVPVHLGAMGESVRTVIAHRGRDMRPGDAIVQNNPYNGGTHLPDVTVVSPVFDRDGRTLKFFVANRAHHADIGGKTPGSTPADSRTLEEEGVVIDDFLLVQDGEFREAAFTDLLSTGRFPARNPDTNLADVKAQLAANEAGRRELTRLVERHGCELVERYMDHVMANAEESVRKVLGRIKGGEFAYPMDDGSWVRVAVEVDRVNRSATIDFTGTSSQREGNFNAPPAVTRATVLYVFRCLIGDDLPLNEGCLRPLNILLPKGSFLAPEGGRAVVAGNTEVSQAVCNALLGALGASACSQATMNNFLFGDAEHQYYETICGGAGAGPEFAGASAVHTHMTNTRITDPEVLELRYPVRLERFEVRRGSGGAGAHPGGDGARRVFQFLRPMTATIVASRRTVAPFGLRGGEAGAVGRQWIERADGSREDLPGSATVAVSGGDRIVIETPGGGGFGPRLGK